MSTHSIGTENESSLHKSLKFRYTGPKGKTEVEDHGFVADGISADGEYIEVQTGSFAPLKKKVKEFASHGKVRIIHPIAVSKKIEVFSPKEKRKKKSGELLYRRKSPVKGSLWKLFDALIYAPELPLTKGLKIEVVLIDVTEKRVKDGKGSWRRKGISIKDRSLYAWHESVLFEKPKDYLRFIPFKKKENFTTADLAKQEKINKWTARKVLYVLTKIKVVKRIGKQKNSWIYIRRI